MKKALLTFGLLLALAGVGATDPLELVESFPRGTDFDQADIRNTSEVWLELINGAEEEILWQTFYCAHEPGKATVPILEALKRAAHRHVKVRLLVDEKFLETYPEPLKQLARLPNIEVRPSPIGRWYGGVMHAKTLLVDGEVGFLGSQNLDWRSLEHIRELGIVFRDPVSVQRLSQIFEWEWNHYKDEAPPPDLPHFPAEQRRVGEQTIRLTASPNAGIQDQKATDEFEILRLLEKAESSIQVALLSYHPVTRDGQQFYPALDNALRAAAVRGVKIQLLLSHWVEKEKQVGHLLSLDTLDNVEVRACRIPEAAEGAIPFARVHHSKYLVVDDKEAWLGTSNWAKGYFYNSRNYGMVILDGPIPVRLGKLFRYDWERSTPLQKKSSSVGATF